jgi:hypothetical protein
MRNVNLIREFRVKPDKEVAEAKVRRALEGSKGS